MFVSCRMSKCVQVQLSETTMQCVWEKKNNLTEIQIKGSTSLSLSLKIINRVLSFQLIKSINSIKKKVRYNISAPSPDFFNLKVKATTARMNVSHKHKFNIRSIDSFIPGYLMKALFRDNFHLSFSPTLVQPQYPVSKAHSSSIAAIKEVNRIHHV